jgi:hypothetical protein
MTPSLISQLIPNPEHKDSPASQLFRFSTSDGSIYEANIKKRLIRKLNGNSSLRVPISADWKEYVHVVRKQNRFIFALEVVANKIKCYATAPIVSYSYCADSKPS